MSARVSWGKGSGGHLTMESLKRQARLDIAHVQYKGYAPCIQDLLAVAPAGTPQEIIQRLSAEINAALQDPAIVERFRALDLDDLPITAPERFSRTVRDDMASWSALIRELNPAFE
jgi:tripartite-type tricarboxylate transporter receptor subunit TctC